VDQAIEEERGCDGELHLRSECVLESGDQHRRRIARADDQRALARVADRQQVVAQRELGRDHRSRVLVARLEVALERGGKPGLLGERERALVGVEPRALDQHRHQPVAGALLLVMERLRQLRRVDALAKQQDLADAPRLRHAAILDAQTR